MNIRGNLLSIHTTVGGSETIVFVVHGGVMGGQFNCRPEDVTCDGRTGLTPGQIVDWTRSRSYVTAWVRGVDETDVEPPRRAATVDLTTAEEPHP